MKHIKLFEGFSKEENMAKSYTLEFLPKFWEDLGIKRPAFGAEAGHSLLNRDNTIKLTVGNDPTIIYRRDTRMYDDKGRKAGRDDDSIWYSINLYKTPNGFISKSDNNMLKYSLDFQEDKDAKIGGNMNLIPIGVGEFASEEVGSMDNREFFKIVAVD